MKFFDVTFFNKFADGQRTSLHTDVLIRKIPGKDEYVLKTNDYEAFCDIKNHPHRIKADSYHDAIKYYLRNEFYFCDVEQVFIKEAVF